MQCIVRNLSKDEFTAAMKVIIDKSKFTFIILNVCLKKFSEDFLKKYLIKTYVCVVKVMKSQSFGFEKEGLYIAP